MLFSKNKNFHIYVTLLLIYVIKVEIILKIYYILLIKSWNKGKISKRQVKEEEKNEEKYKILYGLLSSKSISSST